MVIRKEARRVLDPIVRSGLIEPVEISPDESTVPYRRCRPGSIEQQLDMCETGDLRGDEIEHHSRGDFEDPLGYEPDMAEDRREGDDWSGNEHSSGFQGTDQGPGMPGSLSDEIEKLERKAT